MTPDAIPEIALEWHRTGRGATLATVVETWGSAPRRAGSQLVVAGDGAIMGSVSGGCVEGAVIVEAIEALAQGRPRLLRFGVSDGDAFAVGLACGGTIRVLLEPVGSAMPEPHLAALVAARAARRPIAHVVDLVSWQSRLVGPEDPHLGAVIATRLRQDRSGAEGSRFIGIHNPPLRLFAVGAVHIAQPLVAMARLAGHDPVLIDPREAFATAARFPGETVLDLWPDAALREVGLDARCAVVALSHDPKIDDPALQVALGSDAFYIGALGSRRTHAAREDRLRDAGFGPDAIARIHGPVGLDIAAQTPAEIALAILAQMTEALRRA